MGRKASRAFHCGGYGKVCKEHNQRAKEVVEKEKHIDPNGYYKILEERDWEQTFDEYFTKSIEEYNQGKKPSRQVYGKNGKEYLAKLIKDYQAEQEKNEEIKVHNAGLPKKEWKKETHRCPSPIKEVIVGVYGEGIGREEQEEMAEEFLKRWKEKNPQCVVVGAYFHADEKGGPHLHIDYITVAYENKQGPAVQVSESKCLKEMGYEQADKLYDYETKRFDTPQIRFEDAGRALLDEIMKEHEIEVIKNENAEEKQKHKEKNDYILEQETKKADKLEQANKDKEKDLEKITQTISKKREEMISIELYTEELKDTLTTTQNTLQKAQEDVLALQGEVSTLQAEKTALKGQIEAIKGVLKEFVEKFEFLVKKVTNRDWGNIIKQRKAEAAIRSGNQEKETVEDYLNNNDLSAAVPTKSIERLTRHTMTLEEMDEEWER